MMHRFLSAIIIVIWCASCASLRGGKERIIEYREVTRVDTLIKVDTSYVYVQDSADTAVSLLEAKNIELAALVESLRDRPSEVIIETVYVNTNLDTVHISGDYVDAWACVTRGDIHLAASINKKIEYEFNEYLISRDTVITDKNHEVIYRTSWKERIYALLIGFLIGLVTPFLPTLLRRSVGLLS